MNAALPIGVVKELGAAAKGVIVCQVMPNVNNVSIPVVREYQQALRDQGQAQFSSASLEGFINAKVMVEGLRRMGRNASRTGLMQALEGMSGYDVGGMRVGYGPGNRDGSKYVELSIISSDASKFVY